MLWPQIACGCPYLDTTLDHVEELDNSFSFLWRPVVQKSHRFLQLLVGLRRAEPTLTTDERSGNGNRKRFQLPKQSPSGTRLLIDSNVLLRSPPNGLHILNNLALRKTKYSKNSSQKLNPTTLVHWFEWHWNYRNWSSLVEAGKATWNQNTYSTVAQKNLQLLETIPPYLLNEPI